MWAVGWAASGRAGSPGGKRRGQSGRLAGARAVPAASGAGSPGGKRRAGSLGA